MKVLAIFSLFLCASTVFAGAANVELKCSSGSGRTKLIGYVPGDMTDAVLTLKVDQAAVTYLNRDAITDAVINNQPTPKGKISEIDTLDLIEKKAYSLLVKTSKGDYNIKALSLIAIPDTVRLSESNSEVSATFNAKLNGLDPRIEFGYLPEITLNCSYVYSL